MGDADTDKEQAEEREGTSAVPKDTPQDEPLRTPEASSHAEESAKRERIDDEAAGAQRPPSDS